MADLPKRVEVQVVIRIEESKAFNLQTIIVHREKLIFENGLLVERAALPRQEIKIDAPATLT